MISDYLEYLIQIALLIDIEDIRKTIDDKEIGIDFLLGILELRLFNGIVSWNMEAASHLML